jgi:hypothetical protein
MKKSPLSHEDFQRARRISKALKEYFKMGGSNGIRSTDIYPILERKGLIEKDRHQGLQLRKFLHHLLDHEMLHLIPECQYRTTRSDTMVEWYFYKVEVKNEYIPVQSEIEVNEPRIVLSPAMNSQDIDQFNERFREEISNFPTLNPDKLTFTQRVIRKDYPRAYDSWSKREEEIMRECYNAYKNIEKIAQLLKRQTSAVKTRLGV